MIEDKECVVFAFEDVGEGLNLLPLAARRALDVTGLRLSLEGYQSLPYEDRRELGSLGTKDVIDTAAVERLVRKCSTAASRIKPVPDPHARVPPEQLNAALGPKRGVDPVVWSKLRALDRYALIHVMRRSIAHGDPSRLEEAADVLLYRGKPQKGAPGPSNPSPKPLTEPDAGAKGLPSPSWVPMALRTDGIAEDRLTPVGAGEILPSTTRRPSREPTLELGSDGAPRAAPSQKGTSPSTSNRGGSPKGDSPQTAKVPKAAARSHASEDDRRTAEGAMGMAPAHANRSAKAHGPPSSEREDPSFALANSSDHAGRETLSTHLDEAGNAHMVDIGAKAITARRATAIGTLRMSVETAQKLAGGETPKGDVFACARVAAIFAAKRTPELIPLCHHVAVTSVEVFFDLEIATGSLSVTAIVEALDRTGVEMEALTATTVGCLTVYDMLKGMDRDMVIEDVKLMNKSGGRTGLYVRGRP